MKKILFVHGFGVKRDARGMFTDIAANLPNFSPVNFDLNTIDENENLVVSNFSSQVETLKDIWKKESADHEVYIIAHSQGCLVTAIADLPGITKTFFLAPPTNFNVEILDYFKAKTGTEQT